MRAQETGDRGWCAGKRQSGRIGLGRLCHLLGYTRQAYYERRRCKQEQGAAEAFVLEMVRRERRVQPRLGTRKLYAMLMPRWSLSGVRIGRDRFFGLLREQGMLVVRRKRTCRTTNSRHWFTRYANLLQRFSPSRPNQVWVSDLTYLRTEKGWCYLSLITDAYSRKIVGYNVGESLGTATCTTALTRALKAGKGATAGLIHHSDRGVQYCSHEYTAKLRQNGILSSMGEIGNPYENAIAERVNGILKYEYGLEDTFKSRSEALKQVKQAIRCYNKERPHLSLGMLTPEEVHSGRRPALPPLWKPYKKSRDAPRQEAQT